MRTNTFDVVVAGAGISGLTAAAAAANRGARVALVTTGPGSFVFGCGGLDASDCASDAPELGAAVTFFCEVARLAGCPFAGDLTGALQLPNLLGEFHRVMLAPKTICGCEPGPALTTVVGISGLGGFDEKFLAERLQYSCRRAGMQSNYAAARIDLGTDFDPAVTLMRIAQRFDRDPEFRAQLGGALRAAGFGSARILVPGMLGLHTDEQQRGDFEAEVGCRVSELATLPPTIPSLRVYHRLKAYLKAMGVEVYDGFPVSGLEIAGGVCTALEIASPGRPMILHGGTVILAIGRHTDVLLGGGSSGQDGSMRALDGSGEVIADNVLVAGSPAHRGTGGDMEGILTGYRAGMLSAFGEVSCAKR